MAAQFHKVVVRFHVEERPQTMTGNRELHELRETASGESGDPKFVGSTLRAMLQFQKPHQHDAFL